VFVSTIGIEIGCGTASNPDTTAAREFLRSLNQDAEGVIVDQPEYAAIPKIPKRVPGDPNSAQGAACGVRVRFINRDGGGAKREDWVVWVTRDHAALDWTGNGDGDNWRQYVRSLAHSSEGREDSSLRPNRRFSLHEIGESVPDRIPSRAAKSDNMVNDGPSSFGAALSTATNGGRHDGK
jgi:hypothetical protein